MGLVICLKGDLWRAQLVAARQGAVIRLGFDKFQFSFE